MNILNTVEFGIAFIRFILSELGILFELSLSKCLNLG